METKSNRLVAIDVFRGFTIFSMLLVNNPANDSAYPSWFRHADWGKGITFCDMILPWFLFVMGVSIPFSFSKFVERKGSKFQYLLKSIRRSVILVFLGIIINCSIDKIIVIKMDVLQLLGISFFVAVVTYFLPLFYRFLVPILFIIGYYVLVRWVPFDGNPGGTFMENNNIIYYLNQKYLSKYHLSGILSVIPSSALVIFGTFIGDLLRRAQLNKGKKLFAVLVIGVGASLVGWLWNFDLIFCKAVWTPSYVLFSFGLGCIILSLCYYVTEIKGYRSWGFIFRVFGANAITAYFVSIIVRIHTLEEWQIVLKDGSVMSLKEAIISVMVGNLGLIIGSWVYTVGYIFSWWIVLFIMYRKNIFIKI